MTIASALHLLKCKAYAIEACNATEVLTQDEWQFQYEEENPQFKFWNIALHCITLRTTTYGICKIIGCLVLITFIMLVHIRDMRNVKEHHPELYQEFKSK